MPDPTARDEIEVLPNFFNRLSIELEATLATLWTLCTIPALATPKVLGDRLPVSLEPSVN